MINEMSKHVLHGIELTDFQKKVLARAVHAGAIDDASRVQLNDEKLTAARDILDELGIIDYSHKHNTIKINDVGITLMQEEGIIGDDEALTPAGEAMLNDRPQNGQSAMEHQTFKEYYNSLLN